jgi:hypothetical protein
MKPIARIAFLSLWMSLWTTISLAPPARTAWDPEDPLGGERMLLPSYEIMALRADPVLLPRLYDATGDAATDGVVRTEVFTPPTGYRGQGYDFDGVAADFDGDGIDEFAYAYEANDGRAYLRIMETDEGPSGSVSGLYAALGVMGGDTYERQIRLVAGNMDADPEIELAFAYRTSSSSMYVEFLEVDAATLESTRQGGSSVSNTIQGGFTCSTISGAVRSRFDLAMSDLDGDGLDEVVLANLVHVCDTVSSSQVFVTRYKGGPGGVVQSGFSQALYFSFPYTNPRNFYESVAIAVGDFDGGPSDKQVAIVAKTISFTAREVWSQFVGVSAEDGLEIVSGPQKIEDLRSTPVVRDDRLDVEAADLDRDGRAELVMLEGHRLLIHRMNGSYLLARNASASAVIGIVTPSSESGLGRLVVADLDASVSETFMPEIVVANATNLTMDIFRPFKDPNNGNWSLDKIATPPLANEINADMTLVALNVDDDGVYLGTPRAELREAVFQPVVILNAPPVHFDVVDSQVYDVSGCWDLDECEHAAMFTATSDQEMQIETEVTADWSVSSELRASASFALGFIESSIEATLGAEVGGGFSRIQSNSTFKTIGLGALAAREDLVFGTLSDYMVFEYPVFADANRTQPVTHVVAVVPGEVEEAWRTLKSITDFGVLQNHEPGNLLSYSASTEPLDNEMLEIDLPFQNLGPSLQISESSRYDWFLDFGDVVEIAQEQSSQQSVSAGFDADFEGGAFGITAGFGISVDGRYGSGGINTHRTVATSQNSLDVTLSNIESDLPVDGFQTSSDWATYNVTPYAYWSYSGALVVDYAVELPLGLATAPSFWRQLYGLEADLTWSMPWRLDAAKEGFPNEVLLAERTRDLIAFPALPELGERVTLQARVQNYSLVSAELPVVFFYQGDTSGPNQFLGVGRFESSLSEIPARGEAIVSLEDFAPPSGIVPETRIYAVIHAAGEMRVDNNQAWNFAGFRSLPSCANGLDDDGDGDVDGEDDECLVGGDPQEVPEPGVGLALAVGAFGLGALRRRSITAMETGRTRVSRSTQRASRSMPADGPVDLNRHIGGGENGP